MKNGSYTLPETNSLHLKKNILPQKETGIPTIHFQVRKCEFQGGQPTNKTTTNIDRQTPMIHN